MVVASSGREVPTPMMVAPMMEVGKLMKSAISIELFTISWDKPIIITKQIANFMAAIRGFSVESFGCSVIWDCFGVFEMVKLK